MAIDLTDATFHETIKNVEGVSVVQFTADWCMPCKMLAPRLEDFTQEHGINYFKVNVDESSELARDFRIMSLPTLRFYRNGDSFKTTVGVQSNAQLREIVEDYL